MLLNLVLWSFLIAGIPLALDVAIQLTAAIARALASILKGDWARPDQGDRLSSRSWSHLSSH